MNYKLLLLLIFSVYEINAQWKWTGVGEVYSSISFNKDSVKNDLVYNHKTNNRIGINYLYLKAQQEQKNYRANLALMLGEYAQNNLASEPLWARFISEANIGVRMHRKREIWLDAGIFPSHIGFETVNNLENYTLTRSIVADNTPYYESGLKLSSSTQKLKLGLLLLNGWQNIGRREPIGLGLSGIFTPSEKVEISYNNYFNFTDDVLHNRFHHNFYLRSRLKSKWDYVIGVDLDYRHMNQLRSTNFQLRHKINTQSTVAVRAEYYQYNSFAIRRAIQGASMNYDYIHNPHIIARIELKLIHELINSPYLTMNFNCKL